MTYPKPRPGFLTSYVAFVFMFLIIWVGERWWWWVITVWASFSQVLHCLIFYMACNHIDHEVFWYSILFSIVFQTSVNYLYFLYYNSEGRERIITRSTSNHWFCSRLHLGVHSNWYCFYIHLETSIGVSIWLLCSCQKLLN